MSLQTIIEGMPQQAKYMLALLVSVATVALVAFVGIATASFIFHTNLQHILANISDSSTPQHLSLLRYFLLFQTFLLFGVPPLAIVLLFGKPLLATFQCHTFPSWKLLLQVIVVMLVSFPVINSIADYNGKLLDFLLGANNALKLQEDATQHLVESLLNQMSVSSILYNFVAIALFPAVFEELFFRGFLQNVVLKKFMNAHWAIFLTAFIFSFIHFQFYGFIPRLLLGLFFGYVLEWGKSLWTTIIAHCLNNGLAVFLSILTANGMFDKDIETYGTQGNSLYITGFSIVVTSFMIWKLAKTYSSNQTLNTP